MSDSLVKFKKLLKEVRKQYLNNYLEAMYASIAAEHCAEKIDFWRLDWATETMKTQLANLSLWDLGRVDAPIRFRNSDDGPGKDKDDWGEFKKQVREELESTLNSEEYQKDC